VLCHAFAFLCCIRGESQKIWAKKFQTVDQNQKGKLQESNPF
jgi:hypothetical protein